MAEVLQGRYNYLIDCSGTVDSPSHSPDQGARRVSSSRTVAASVRPCRRKFFRAAKKRFPLHARLARTFSAHLSSPPPSGHNIHWLINASEQVKAVASLSPSLSVSADAPLFLSSGQLRPGGKVVSCVACNLVKISAHTHTHTRWRHSKQQQEMGH